MCYHDNTLTGFDHLEDGHHYYEFCFDCDQINPLD